PKENTSANTGSSRSVAGTGPPRPDSSASESRSRQSAELPANRGMVAVDKPAAKAVNRYGTSAKPPGAKSLGLLSAWFSHRAPNQSPEPQGNIPVQYELSLDRIKVVRNDLSDTDLEIVAGKGVEANGRVLVPPRIKPLAEVPTRVAKATTRLLSTLRT